MPEGYHESVGGPGLVWGISSSRRTASRPGRAPPGLWRLAVCHLVLVVLLLTEVATGALAL
jgi:hypothetical protein